MLYFLTSALEGCDGSGSRPGRTLPPGKTRYPLYRRLVGPQGRSGQVWKISIPPGFDSRTVQPVGSRYTDYATRPTYTKVTMSIKVNSTVIFRCHNKVKRLKHHIVLYSKQAGYSS